LILAWTSRPYVGSHGFFELGVVDGDVVFDFGDGNDAGELRRDTTRGKGELDAVDLLVIGKVGLNFDRTGGSLSFDNRADEQTGLRVERKEARRARGRNGFKDPDIAVGHFVRSFDGHLGEEIAELERQVEVIEPGVGGFRWGRAG